MTFLANSQKIKNTVNLVDNSFTSVQVGTTVITYPGTLVDYTPEPSSSHVVFECHTQIAWNPDASQSYAEIGFQYSTDGGSSWQDFSNCQLFEGINSSTPDYFWWTQAYTFVVDSWSGQRKLRLATRAYRTESEFTVGRSWNTYPNSSVGVGSMTQVSVYSVM